VWGLLAAFIAQAAPVRHALVIGANDGGGVLEPLRYAERDAEEVASVLTGLGGFPADHVTVLYAPSRVEIQAALGRHAAVAAAEPDDLFLVYYSGHADAVGLRLGDDSYPFEALKHDLRAVPAEVRIGLLDACRSGAITRLKGASLAPPLALDGSFAVDGEAWLTASSADEAAQESDQLRSGFFTYYLLSGMRGAADHGDGSVDLDELYRYAFDRVVAHTGATEAGTQHPHFDNRLSGAGEVVITRPNAAGATLTLGDAAVGLVSVLRLPDLLPVAEVVVVPGTPRVVAVPEGRYLLRRRTSDGLSEVTVGVTLGANAIVSRWGEVGAEVAGVRGAGDDAASSFVDASEERIARMRLDEQPGVAGAMSLMVPGTGQLYNGQGVKGLAYFGLIASTFGGSVAAAGEGLPSAGFAAFGLAAWGASVADATWNVHRREDRMATGAFRLGASATTGGYFHPVAGVSFDVLAGPRAFIGLDRVGFTPGQGGAFDAAVGTRAGVDLARFVRWRSSALLAIGVRSGRDPQGPSITRAAVGGGLELAYQVVPRYALTMDVRYEAEGVRAGPMIGIGGQVLLGR
jgi:hypothetical protein